jgi:hypothetical protein
MKRKFMMTACILAAVFIFAAAIIAVLEKAGVTNFINDQKKTTAAVPETISQTEVGQTKAQTSDTQNIEKPDREESIGLRSRGE